jgi:nucleoside-diphosphate kinase
MHITLAMLKPDCFHRRLVGKMISRLEEHFQISAIKTVWLDQSDVDFLYGKYKGKEFYEVLSAFMMSGPCHVLCLESRDAVSRLRDVIGAEREEPGTIRGDYANKEVRRENVMHASDSDSSALLELEHFFSWEERKRLGIVFGDEELVE